MDAEGPLFLELESFRLEPDRNATLLIRFENMGDPALTDMHGTLEVWAFPHPGTAESAIVGSQTRYQAVWPDPAGAAPSLFNETDTIAGRAERVVSLNATFERDVAADAWFRVSSQIEYRTAKGETWLRTVDLCVDPQGTASPLAESCP